MSYVHFLRLRAVIDRPYRGRILSATYEDGDTVAYAYDNSGRLATVTDSATGRTTTYTYDFADRTVKYTETGTNYSHSVEYGYDETGKLLSQIEVINGTTHTTSYEYDDDNRVTSKTTDGITVEYTYDGLGRVSQQVTKNGDTTVKTETYTFNANSAQVATYRTQAGSYDVTYTYTYDDNGNILTINDGTNTTSYEYDSQNQLIRENNQASGFTRTWTYDNAGNILGRNQYSYTADELGAVKSTASYTYGDEDWGDLLTAYNGTAITYDGIGNPTAYRGMQFTWEHGRQLASAQYGSVTETYTYDTDGMRTGRTSGSNTYKYVYNGSQLAQMEYHSGSTNVTLAFTYDAQGTPVSFTANGVQFYYLTNLQGDVVGITNASGGVVARYTYDAWGTCAVSSNNLMGQVNPLRYRGYVYDVETELYYLQSRYYDPTVGRFINADSLTSTDQGLTGNNMFAYCGNNPVIRVDANGMCYGYPDDPNLDSLYSGRDFGIPCGLYGFHVRHPKMSTAYRDVTDEIICALEKEYKRIKKRHSSWAYQIGITILPIGRVNEYYEFYTLVNHKAVWDIKLKDPWQETIKTEYPGQQTRVIFDGRIMTPELLGNFTYGAIGYWYDIPFLTLLAGSYYAASFPTSGDKLNNEMKDWIFIFLGYDYGESFPWRDFL